MMAGVVVEPESEQVGHSLHLDRHSAAVAADNLKT